MEKSWKKKTSLFLASQAISLFGSSLVQFAIIWYITLKTNSGLMMTIATLCSLIPQVLISLFAGVWADRYNKKVLIILSDGLIALATAIITILFFLGIDSLWLLFVVLAIRSFGSGIQSPTVTSFIPELVPEQHLMKINGLNTTIQSIMLILSPAVSGALLANVNLEYIFLIDIITALIGIFIFMTVKVNYVKKEIIKGNYFISIKEGLVYAKSHKLIARMIVYLLLANILITPLSTLTPLLVTRTFGTEPLYLTLNEIVFFVGSVIGGIFISIWGGFKNRIHTIGIGCILCGVFSICLGIPINLVFYLVSMGLIGFVMPMFNTPFITLLQENVEADKQGRIFSLITMLSSTIVPLSMIFFGPLSDAVKIEWILIINGILFLVATIYLMRDKVLNKVIDLDN